MIAIIGGLAAAVLWSVSTLATSRSTKIVTPTTVLAWVMTIGAALVAPFALATGVPDALGGDELAWLITSGLANLYGLLLSYSSLRVGKVGLVAPITSAQGAAAALIAVVAGERIAGGSGAMLALIGVGVIFASVSGAAEEAEDRRDGRAVVLAACAAVLFGLGLYASGRLAGELPIVWVVFVPRLVGTLAFALPMALLGRVHMTRRALPFVVVSAVCEIVGLAFFLVAAREGIAVAAILGSQFAALAAVAAYFLFGERLRGIQVAGVVAILVGVSVLTGLQA
ncbi:MAG TPA: EamA family transporter [Actinomycetota bacterium]|nr:EamA family transporter [Actinomycetota bacterium]